MRADNLPVQKLSGIIPEGVFVGTSLILRQGDRFLYGVRPVRRMGDRQILELLVVGKLQPPAKECWARLTDSQEALALALGDDAPRFFQSVGMC